MERRGPSPVVTIAGSVRRIRADETFFAFRYPDAFQQLIDLLARASVEYLVAQAKRGVEAVQIFDSWCGLLPWTKFDWWCVQPVKWMVSELRARCPDLKIIVLPKPDCHFRNRRRCCRRPVRRSKSVRTCHGIFRRWSLRWTEASNGLVNSETCSCSRRWEFLRPDCMSKAIARLFGDI